MINGNLEVVQFLHTFTRANYSKEAIELTKANGNLNIIKYLDFKFAKDKYIRLCLYILVIKITDLL